MKGNDKIGMYEKITKENKEQCEKMLSDFCQTRDITLSINSDIVKVCQKLGFRVLSLTLKDALAAFDGVILVDNKNKVIGVNDKLDFKKARFTVAHELSHYIYNEMSDHRSEIVATRDTIFHKEKKPMLEHLMDYMAAMILVPENDFKNELKSLNVKLPLKDEEKLPANIISYLAYTFQVDEDVIERRIKEVA